MNGSAATTATSNEAIERGAAALEGEKEAAPA